MSVASRSSPSPSTRTSSASSGTDWSFRRGALERAGVDATEAWLLAGQEGRDFPAVVLDAGKDKGTVVRDAPAVRAACAGADLPVGERITVRLEVADQEKRVVRFSRAAGPAPVA